MRTGIALGSNLGDRLAHLREGRAAVMRLPGVSDPLHSSRIYETEPVDTVDDSAPFLNAVIEVEYHGEPLALLHGLQSIEQRMGRPSRHPQHTARTLDLDVLYMGQVAVALDSMIIPHPRMHLRRFVLAPLADICPGLILPAANAPVSALLSALGDSPSVEVYSATWE